MGLSASRNVPTRHTAIPVLENIATKWSPKSVREFLHSILLAQHAVLGGDSDDSDERFAELRAGTSTSINLLPRTTVVELIQPWASLPAARVYNVFDPGARGVADVREVGAAVVLVTAIHKLEIQRGTSAAVLVGTGETATGVQRLPQNMTDVMSLRERVNLVVDITLGAAPRTHDPQSAVDYILRDEAKVAGSAGTDEEAPLGTRVSAAPPAAPAPVSNAAKARAVTVSTSAALTYGKVVKLLGIAAAGIQKLTGVPVPASYELYAVADRCFDLPPAMDPAETGRSQARFNAYIQRAADPRLLISRDTFIDFAVQDGGLLGYMVGLRSMCRDQFNALTQASAAYGRSAVMGASDSDGSDKSEDDVTTAQANFDMRAHKIELVLARLGSAATAGSASTPKLPLKQQVWALDGLLHDVRAAAQARRKRALRARERSDRRAAKAVLRKQVQLSGREGHVRSLSRASAPSGCGSSSSSDSDSSSSAASTERLLAHPLDVWRAQPRVSQTASSPALHSRPGGTRLPAATATARNGGTDPADPLLHVPIKRLLHGLPEPLMSDENAEWALTSVSKAAASAGAGHRGEPLSLWLGHTLQLDMATAQADASSAVATAADGALLPSLENAPNSPLGCVPPDFAQVARQYADTRSEAREPATHLSKDLPVPALDARNPADAALLLATATASRQELPPGILLTGATESYGPAGEVVREHAGLAAMQAWWAEVAGSAAVHPTDLRHQELAALTAVARHRKQRGRAGAGHVLPPGIVGAGGCRYASTRGTEHGDALLGALCVARAHATAKAMQEIEKAGTPQARVADAQESTTTPWGVPAAAYLLSGAGLPAVAPSASKAVPVYDVLRAFPLARLFAEPKRHGSWDWASAGRGGGLQFGSSVLPSFGLDAPPPVVPPNPDSAPYGECMGMLDDDHLFRTLVGSIVASLQQLAVRRDSVLCRARLLAEAKAGRRVHTLQAIRIAREEERARAARRRRKKKGTAGTAAAETRGRTAPTGGMTMVVGPAPSLSGTMPSSPMPSPMPSAGGPPGSPPLQPVHGMSEADDALFAARKQLAAGRQALSNSLAAYGLHEDAISDDDLFDGAPDAAHACPPASFSISPRAMAAEATPRRGSALGLASTTTRRARRRSTGAKCSSAASALIKGARSAAAAMSFGLREKSSPVESDLAKLLGMKPRVATTLGAGSADYTALGVLSDMAAPAQPTSPGRLLDHPELATHGGAMIADGSTQISLSGSMFDTGVHTTFDGVLAKHASIAAFKLFPPPSGCGGALMPELDGCVYDAMLAGNGLVRRPSTADNHASEQPAPAEAALAAVQDAAAQLVRLPDYSGSGDVLDKYLGRLRALQAIQAEREAQQAAVEAAAAEAEAARPALLSQHSARDDCVELDASFGAVPSPEQLPKLTPEAVLPPQSAGHSVHSERSATKFEGDPDEHPSWWHNVLDTPSAWTALRGDGISLPLLALPAAHAGKLVDLAATHASASVQLPAAHAADLIDVLLMAPRARYVPSALRAWGSGGAQFGPEFAPLLSILSGPQLTQCIDSLSTMWAQTPIGKLMHSAASHGLYIPPEAYWGCTAFLGLQKHRYAQIAGCLQKMGCAVPIGSTAAARRQPAEPHTAAEAIALREAQEEAAAAAVVQAVQARSGRDASYRLAHQRALPFAAVLAGAARAAGAGFALARVVQSLRVIAGTYNEASDIPGTITAQRRALKSFDTMLTLSATPFPLMVQYLLGRELPVLHAVERGGVMYLPTHPLRLPLMLDATAQASSVAAQAGDAMGDSRQADLVAGILEPEPPRASMAAKASAQLPLAASGFPLHTPLSESQPVYAAAQYLLQHARTVAVVRDAVHAPHKLVGTVQVLDILRYIAEDPYATLRAAMHASVEQAQLHTLGQRASMEQPGSSAGPCAGSFLCVPADAPLLEAWIHMFQHGVAAAAVVVSPALAHSWVELCQHAHRSSSRSPSRGGGPRGQRGGRVSDRGTPSAATDQWSAEQAAAQDAPLLPKIAGVDAAEIQAWAQVIAGEQAGPVAPAWQAVAPGWEERVRGGVFIGTLRVSQLRAALGSLRGKLSHLLAMPVSDFLGLTPTAVALAPAAGHSRGPSAASPRMRGAKTGAPVAMRGPVCAPPHACTTTLQESVIAVLQRMVAHDVEEVFVLHSAAPPSTPEDVDVGGDSLPSVPTHAPKPPTHPRRRRAAGSHGRHPRARQHARAGKQHSAAVRADSTELDPTSVSAAALAPELRPGEVVGMITAQDMLRYVLWSWEQAKVAADATVNLRSSAVQGVRELEQCEDSAQPPRPPRNTSFDVTEASAKAAMEILAAAQITKRRRKIAAALAERAANKAQMTAHDAGSSSDAEAGLTLLGGVGGAASAVHAIQRLRGRLQARRRTKEQA